jgi:hypothetical protein
VICTAAHIAYLGQSGVMRRKVTQRPPVVHVEDRDST